MSALCVFGSLELVVSAGRGVRARPCPVAKLATSSSARGLRAYLPRSSKNSELHIS